MLKEFRDFLMRGSLVELAVAFVMGLAFAALINSFVNDLVMPIIAMIIGKPDSAASRSRSTTQSSATAFPHGILITFVATAAAIFFFVVKPLGRDSWARDEASLE